jgi:hypothetical protein
MANASLFAEEPDPCIQLERINFFFLVSVLGRLADSPRAQRPKQMHSATL